MDIKLSKIATKRAFHLKIGGDNTVLINGNWEQIKDLSDVVRIVKENIGDEFAREVERICGELSLELEEQNFILQNKIDNMKDAFKEARKIFIEVLGLADKMNLNNNMEVNYDKAKRSTRFS